VGQAVRTTWDTAFERGGYGLGQSRLSFLMGLAAYGVISPAQKAIVALAQVVSDPAAAPAVFLNLNERDSDPGAVSE